MSPAYKPRTNALLALILGTAIAVGACSDSKSPMAPSPVTTPAVTVAAVAAVDPPVAVTTVAAAAPRLESIDIQPKEFIGSVTTTGTVTLTTTATSNVVVALASSKNEAEPPVSVQVLAGNRAATFSLPTKDVSADMEVWITATVDEGRSQATQQIRLWPRIRGGGGEPVATVPGSGGGTAPPAAPSGYSLGANIAPFGGLSGSALTCTNSTVTGDVGVSPGTSITGFPGLCTLNGQIRTTPSSVAAKADLASKYASLSALPCQTISSLMNGLVLTAGTYCVPAGTTNLSANMTLNGAGGYVFIFTSTFVTTPGASMSLISGAECGAVTFVVGSSATLAGSLSGNVIAQQSVTMTSATLIGRALAINAAVTLTTSTLSNAGCS